MHACEVRVIFPGDQGVANVALVVKGIACEKHRKGIVPRLGGGGVLVRSLKHGDDRGPVQGGSI